MASPLLFLATLFRDRARRHVIGQTRDLPDALKGAVFATFSFAGIKLTYLS